jgi:hypothetical protein
VCLRRGVDEVSERREGGEGLVRDDLDVAIPHAPEVVEQEDVPVDQAHGPGAGQERAGERAPHRQRQDQALQRRAECSCACTRKTKTKSTIIAGRMGTSLSLQSSEAVLLTR